MGELDSTYAKYRPSPPVDGPVPPDGVEAPRFQKLDEDATQLQNDDSNEQSGSAAARAVAPTTGRTGQWGTAQAGGMQLGTAAQLRQQRLAQPHLRAARASIHTPGTACGGTAVRAD